jgi:hypothetical protein
MGYDVYMKNYYYSDKISDFLKQDPDKILGSIASNSEFSDEITQKNAWKEEISILQSKLSKYTGAIYFEYSIPRMGRRIDVLMVIDSVIFVLEFKVGEKEFLSSAVDQVWDYGLDLKNFHETSHDAYIAPILIPTKVEQSHVVVSETHHNDKLLCPIKCSVDGLEMAIDQVLNYVQGSKIDADKWQLGRYHPTPTIVEAAISLYAGHSVSEISRSDAGAYNISKTSEMVSHIIEKSKQNSRKAICFVTGVPGSGKTLVGLNVANQHIDKDDNLYSVYLSGNGPLVAILREALTRDKVLREKLLGNKLKKSEAMSQVKLFIQNVHNFRDYCLVDEKPPLEHVAIFDEAQRAWDFQQTVNFMQRKKNRPNFSQSESEYLITCMDRHKDWAVVVCLVGGGQEINTGEAGISEWLESINRSFKHWDVYISSKLQDSEYNSTEILKALDSKINIIQEDSLHLATSMRSFRSENVSRLVKDLLDVNKESASKIIKEIEGIFPIVITRDLQKAKNWVKAQARGSERYGIVASSQAVRLKPQAIDVKTPVDPIHWFLDQKDDVRSSYYLEDVVTEFQVQGLEIDWSCVTWDGDFRYEDGAWKHFSFVGGKWNRINKAERKMYLKNAYRVLLTRARQGMVIYVPPGSDEDPTRNRSYYDSTFEYLSEIGFKVL